MSSRNRRPRNIVQPPKHQWVNKDYSETMPTHPKVLHRAIERYKESVADGLYNGDFVPVGETDHLAMRHLAEIRGDYS